MPNVFIIDLLGTEISAEEKTILQHPNVGGLLLFTRNFVNPEQLKTLVQTIQAIRPDIFIMVDHEGGIVQRFQRHGWRSLPAARVYGDVYDINHEAGIKLAQQYGEIMANDLLQYGIDLSLAPVLDIHNISNVIAKLDRAFHKDADAVIQLATAFIQGMHKAGMPSVGKHFPGHGSTVADSHTAMPISDTSYEQLKNQDLKPFMALTKANILNAVMPAHITYTAVDPNHPAGFSSMWLQTILRQELQFKGLIISDCLGMAGADIGSMQTRAKSAFEAGCDMLIVCNQTRASLLDVVRTNTFEQTNESAQRIAGFKSHMLRFFKNNPEKKIPAVSSSTHSVDAPVLEKDDKANINNTTSI